MTTLTAPAPPASSGPRPLGDTLALTGRLLRHQVRHVDNLVMTLALPVFLMLLFVYVFGGAVSSSGTGSYVDYVVPGIMILVAGYAAASVATAVAGDVGDGLVDRLRSMPVHAGGLLTGHVIATVVTNAVSMAAALAVAFLAGFHPRASAGAWAVALGLVVLYTVALAWVGVAVGLAVSGPEAASSMTFVLLFLPYVSSAFVPVATLPTWLQGFARHMPLTPVTDAVRDLLSGRHPASSWVAVAWCVAILLAGRAWAVLGWRHGR